jgi:hypothetical protein
MGDEGDLVAGQKLVMCFQPFLEQLAHSQLTPATVRKHVDNLWILGGEVIRSLHYTPALRKRPVDQLLADVLNRDGPIPYHCDSEQHLRSFQSTCRKLKRFLEHEGVT